jgi:hypothetical protein
MNHSDFALIDDPLERLRAITPALRHHETQLKELAKLRDITLLEAQADHSILMTEIMDAANFNYSRMYQKLKQLGYQPRKVEKLSLSQRYPRRKSRRVVTDYSATTVTQPSQE